MVGYLFALAYVAAGITYWTALAAGLLERLPYEIQDNQMIRSFANSATETIWNGKRSRDLSPDIQDRALNRLKMLNRARTLDDLRNPPSNRLHMLKDDRAGKHSISINMQWRICFFWKDGHAYDVEITDYH